MAGLVTQDGLDLSWYNCLLVTHIPVNNPKKSFQFSSIVSMVCHQTYLGLTDIFHISLEDMADIFSVEKNDPKVLNLNP